MTWTRERVELLRRHWAEGESASRIAQLLGGFEHCDDGGRNAVIGKVHRLGLPVRETAVVRGSRTASGGTKLEKGGGKEEAVRPPSNAGHLEPVPLGIPITELRPGQCKWPHGDGPFLFCGHVTEGRAVYCAFHKRLAYRPAEREAKPFVILGGLRRSAA